MPAYKPQETWGESLGNSFVNAYTLQKQLDEKKLKDAQDYNLELNQQTLMQNYRMAEVERQKSADKINEQHYQDEKGWHQEEVDAKYTTVDEDMAKNVYGGKVKPGKYLTSQLTPIERSIDRRETNATNLKIAQIGATSREQIANDKADSKEETQTETWGASGVTIQHGKDKITHPYTLAGMRNMVSRGTGDAKIGDNILSIVNSYQAK
jgi:hypothetical protein